MPENTRSPNFLHLHNTLSRRVSNLETGVHPTRSEFGYGDAYGPTTFTVTSTVLSHLSPGLKWMRRMGVAQFAGTLWFGTGGSAHTHSELAAEEVIGTLPPQARPLVALRNQGQLTVAPWFFQYTIGLDGVVRVIKPSGPAAGDQYTLAFDSAAWTVN